MSLTWNDGAKSFKEAMQIAVHVAAEYQWKLMITSVVKREGLSYLLNSCLLAVEILQYTLYCCSQGGRHMSPPHRLLMLDVPHTSGLTCVR